MNKVTHLDRHIYNELLNFDPTCSMVVVVVLVIIKGDS